MTDAASSANSRRSTPLTAEQLAQVEQSFAEGDVAKTWELLTSFHDSYAAIAAPAIKDPTSLYGQVLRNSWHVVKADFNKIHSTAREHQQNYINIIKRNYANTGSASLPNTTQIEQSYYRALVHEGVPPYAAVNLLLSKISSVTGSKSWYDGIAVEIEPDRKGPPSAEAKILDFSPALGNFAQVSALTTSSQYQWNRARLETSLPLIKYYADIVSNSEERCRGGGVGLFIYTSGGFIIYNNTRIHTFAMFDKGMNGRAWIDGEWQDIHPGNWRPDPYQTESSGHEGTGSSGRAPFRPAGIYQYKDPATGEWKGASLPTDIILRFG
jgi:hypothetical protein